MSNNESVVQNFYSAFKQKNAKEMKACYNPDLQFEDPAFGKLAYTQTCAMWQMLCESARDLSIEFTIDNAQDEIVESTWIAEYTFSKTGRYVRNEISAHMVFKDGNIIRHTDSFNLHKWARQAMGFQGLLLGGTSFFKKKLHQQTGYQLKKYMSKNNLS